MEINALSSKKQEYGLIILGNGGAGKSYICNMIVGYKRFETDFRQEAAATTVEYHRIDTGSSDLLVYNMPGLIESHQEKIDRNKKQIIKVFEQSPTSIVMFVWTQVDGRPKPDDIIAFKALQEAYKFSSKSVMFVVNNIPSKRSPTYEGRFITLLKKTLNPMPISLEDMFFLDTLNYDDNEKFDVVPDIIVKSNELIMLRGAIKQQFLAAEENKRAYELKIVQMAEEYEAFKKIQEKMYEDMVFQLEVTKQQSAAEEEEEAHGLVGIELETCNKEKKVGLKKQCQQLWQKVEDEKGIVKKVEKTCSIARNELLVQYKNIKTHGNRSESEKERNQKLDGCQSNKIWKKLCNDNSDSNYLNPVTRGVIGAAGGAALGAAAGAVVGGAAGIVLGPCAILTAAAGAAAGTAVGTVAGAVSGVAVGGVSSAIITLYRNHKK
uniref:GIMAP7 GTPase n=1 Tax=Adineta vaga TaxID=104782 RepID=B3G4E6_ADIVA|nr:GIMAP7 GTPase [Adineta vaga]